MTHLGPYELDRVHLGDCIELMKALPDKCVDCVVTDPPYGINVIGGSKAFGSIGGSNIVAANKYNPIIGDSSKINLDIIFLKSNDQVIFGGNYFDLPVSKGWIVWDKKCKNGWDDNFSDGEIAWTSFNRPLKIFRHLYMGLMKQNKDEINRCHPTQKPIALMKWIIDKYTSQDAIILDPFSGSGTTGVAAIQTGRRFLGFEIDTRWVDLANKRINAAKAQGVLNL